jgi:hypothetical protein
MMHGRIDAWPGDQLPDDAGALQALRYSGGTLHPKETVDLCHRLTMAAPAANVALVYAHRGHRCQWKTPLLQSLLARLSPRLQVHGLRVDQAHLPLDLLLFAVATLGECDRCIIVKDNAIRLGTTDVVPETTVQYLVLSRSTGIWEVEGISIQDEVPAFPSRMATPSLDTLWTHPPHDADSLSLACPMTNGCFGIIHLVRVRQSDALVKSPRTEACMAYAECLAPTCDSEGIDDA